MADPEAEDAAAASGELVLDPFAFHLGVSSRILGLGGSTPGYDVAYAFHTEYVEAAPGTAHFTLRFANLTARRGTLHLLVNMLPLEEGAHARVVNTDRIQFNRLVRDGGMASIRFDSFRGVSFALQGRVIDDTDAEAASLVVLLDRPANPDDGNTAGAEARSSSFGRDTVKAARHMLSVAAPNLASPVSQMCTEGQLAEPALQSWSGRLGLDDAPPLDRWSAAYVLQALERYGMLAEGASGLGLGAAGGPVAGALAERGVQVALARDGDPEDDGGAVRAVDFRTLPGSLLNFDFVWSEAVAGRQPTVAAALDLVERCMGCLRPGGLAIHLFPYELGTVDSNVGGEGGILFRRVDMERLSLILISRGLEVAQVKVDPANAWSVPDEEGRRVTRFGLIARKPPSAY